MGIKRVIKYREKQREETEHGRTGRYRARKCEAEA